MQARPPDKHASCRIIFDVGVQCFEAYYPKVDASGQVEAGKKGFSTSRSFKEKWSHEKALQHCVDFVYKHYNKCGGVCKLS